jgi:hypothetical protein
MGTITTSLITTRRGLLSFMGGAAGVATFGPIVPARAETRELAWLTWETNGKLVHIAPFEKATGITVKAAYLTSEDVQFRASKPRESPTMTLSTRRSMAPGASSRDASSCRSICPAFRMPP